MSFKKVICLGIIFIVFVTCFSTVYASDFNESDNADVLAIKSDEKVIDSELLADTNPGSFKDLATEIGKVGSGGTLNLTRDYVYSSGDSAVVIDKKITINGNGYKIDASKSGQIFKCYGDEKVFNNIVFSNGRTYDDNGGAIYSESKLTLNNCVFKGNFVSEDYCGIAIYSTSEVILEGCNFTNHIAAGDSDYPYLIYSNSVTVKNSRFFDNSAAAISYQSNLIAINSQFLNNHGTSLNSESAEYTYIKNCTFIRGTTSFMNTLIHSSAISVSSAFGTYSDISLEDCKFINSSAYGQTVSLKFLNGVISNCEFINNLGSQCGGIYCEASNLKIKNSRFELNRCQNRGGAINSFQTQMSIESCDFINNSAISGGAIYWDWKDGSIMSCNFINNSAENGGAISNWNLMNNNIEKSSFINNSDNNGNVILFSGYLIPSTVCYVSKISNNYFDTYDDFYGGGFSFKDNILTVKPLYYSDVNVTVVIDGKTFKKDTVDKVCSIDLSSISTGIYNAKIAYSNNSGASLCEITMPLPIESLLIQVNEVNKIYGGPECLEINLKKYGVPVANANVDIIVNGTTFTRMTDSNGHISMPITLNAGIYDVTVTYQGVTKTSKITVSKLPSKTTLNVYKTSSISLYMNVTVEGANDGDIVVFKVCCMNNGKTDEYKAILKNSKADLNLYDIEGYYLINATYLGNAFSYISYDVKNILLSEVQLFPVIKSRNIIKYWGGSEKLEIILRDELYPFSPIYNATMDIYIGGVKYTRFTDVNGVILMDIDLGIGSYTGDIYYGDAGIAFTVTVKSTVYGEDVVADYGDVTYTARFLDLTGEPLMNGTATFRVNSTDYYATISNGNASIIVDENHGSYVVEVINPVSGESHTNKITVLPLKTETKLSGVKDVNPGDSLTVTANVNSSVGSVVFNIHSTDTPVEVVNNKASFTMDNLRFGTYLITATYVDSEGNFLSSSDSKYFRVSYLSADISVVADDIGAGQNAIFEIVLPSNATGEVRLLINNMTYTNQLSGGKTIFSIPDLAAGNYTYTVVYPGNKIYHPNQISGNISVFIVNVLLNAADLVKYYSSSEQLSAQLLDNSGSPLSGKKIIFTVNAKDYERTTDTSGIASMNINLNSGNYTAGVRFDGNGQYDSIKTVVQIEIKPTVAADDLSKIFRNDNPYYATFVDSKGNLLKNTEVEFNINGVVYTRKTNENGTARLNINLNAGEYVIAATNPSTGEIHTNIITVMPVKTETKLSGVKNITVGDLLTVTANVNSSVGSVVFNIHSTNKTVEVINNRASYTVDNLYAGSYVIKAIYVDSEGNYLSSSDSKSFTVSKRSPDISVVADDIGAGQNAIFEIALASNATGQVSVKINNKVYINQLYNGKIIFSVPDLAVGNYSYDIDYTGDNVYHSKKISGNISVFIINVVLKAPGLVKYYSSSTPLTVQLLDKSGNPLAGQKIIFTLNSKNYERTTNASGIASMNINLNSGNYAAGVRFNGNEQYDSIKTVVQIEVMPTVAANDFSKIFRNDTQYYATFVDSQGNLLNDTSVEFNINGVFYNRKTNENGTARLNINLNPGEYILTAKNPSTGELHATKITVLPSIVENSDITKYYKNATQYSVMLLGADGNPVGAGVNVTFNINGVFYERQTNESGIAKMNINLAPGDYVITAEYNGYKVSNNITVLPVLSAKDVTMKYRDGTKFVATLVDGQGKAYVNQSVKFNINGVFYNRVTDSSGQAKLNINLLAGEYIITSSYNGANIANKITITA